MNPPLVSICITTYNHQNYIEDCLSSVLSQTGNFKLQILIGDDASNDNTVSIAQNIAKQHDANIHIYDHKINLGASQNYQFLIRKAEGDFIAHLDGDDFWLPGKIKAQLAYLHTSTSSIACYTNALIMSNKKEPKGFFNYPQKTSITLEDILNKGNFLNHSSLLYRSDGKKLILDFPENFIDYRIHLNLAKIGQLGYINQALVAYRVNSDTSMLMSMPKKVVLLYYEALKSIQDDVPERLFNLAINKYTASLIVDLIARKEFRFLSEIYQLLKHDKSTSWVRIILRVTLCAVPSEIMHYFFRLTFQSGIKILKRNSKR